MSEWKKNNPVDYLDGADYEDRLMSHKSAPSPENKQKKQKL